MHSTESFNALDAPPPAPLHRTHSLEFLNNPETNENDVDLDIHAAAEMVELFDLDKLLNDVSTPVSSAPQAQASGAVEAGLVLTGGVELPETATGGDTSEASDDSATALADAARVANKETKAQRTTRKDQIIQLRQSVEQLTDLLEALKAEPPQETQLQTHSGSALTTPAGASLWKHVAIGQLGRRRKAEEDNVMLREMLEMQVQEAKCLQRILKRRTKIQMMEDLLGMKRQKTARISSTPSDNSKIFMTMLRETDEIYSRVDSHVAERE
ncbi:hypothetical protein PHYPSEUDO_010139 [Phytophthora pseudosyringae]|uniref:Uncharacterized protein n=1 Tax=Phytophthora pseudosyringae TaxID=221518 RepID=A0A8T1VAP6_9STRA|nr:hypothetical protein PHYPSEUDO_010139 [Phytophthora pseudosyringae]